MIAFRKLSSKIFIAVFLGTAINLIAVSIFAFRFTTSALQQSIMSSQLELARQSMDKIDRLLDARCSEILFLAGVKPFEFFLAPPAGQDVVVLEKIAAQRMNEVVPLTGPWDLLVVTDEKGKVVLSSDEKVIGDEMEENFNVEKNGEKILRQELYYSDLKTFHSVGTSSVLFSAPVRNTHVIGRPVVGSVAGYFSWPALLQILEDIPGRVAIVNREGKVIGKNSEFEKANPSLKMLANPEVIENLKEGNSFSLTDTRKNGLNGEEVLISLGIQSGYLSFEGNGWGLILERPTSVAFAPASKAALKLVLFLIPIIILTSISILILILKWVTHPIAALTQTTREIAGGNLSQKVIIASQDEMGELAASFNGMTEKLRRSRETLEDEVKERTLELSGSVEELKKEMRKRKELEGIVLQSEKMSAVGQLAAGVAHEINNPLGVILGFSQNVVKRIKPGDPLELPLKSIEREAVRCKNLVQDLLTFSRAGKGEKEPVDLKEAIEVALSLVLAQSKVKNTELIKEYSAVPKAMGNKNQIQQIIVNLCNNAMDAMTAGGKLTVRLQKSKLENKDMVEIQIQDTGHGIPEEIRDKVFNPFFTTKEVGKGTGLGLSLVYEIVQKHNGHIQLKSEVGKGSTFEIFLPIAV